MQHRTLVSDDQAQLLHVRGLVERFVCQTASPDQEDVVQETMARLLEQRHRLSPDAWASYATVTARNLLVDGSRDRTLARRHLHRLYQPDVIDPPDAAVLLKEEHQALDRALAQVSDADRELLEQHYSGDVGQRGRLTGAMAARLARSRARLRVAYLLEHGKIELPTPRCRPVLESLSAGDTRRQQLLGAGRHLASCQTCSRIGPGLVSRRRSLVGLGPLVVWAAAMAVLRVFRRYPGPSAVGTAVVTASVVAAVLLAPSPAPEPPISPPPPAGSLTVEGAPLLPGPLPAPLPTGHALAQDLLVQSVPSSAGFWIGAGPGNRMWVAIEDDSSPVNVRPGDRVSFFAHLQNLTPTLADRAALSAEQGVAELLAQDRCLLVRSADLTVRPQ